MSRWAGKLNKPAHAHPLVREFVDLMNAAEKTYADVGAISGLNGDTMRKWGVLGNPTLPNFTAALNALGYDLVIVTAQLPKRPAERREEARA